MNTQTSANKSEKRMGCFSVLGLMLLTVLISVAVTVWFLNVYLFPKRFEPVELSQRETQTLERKLEVFEGIGGSKNTSNTSLEPVPYSEAGADRNLALSERELNAILAKNTDLADKLAIDLSDDLISARLRIPMDPDFPFFGGKLLKARAGVGVKYENGRPVIVLKGISVMGVPVPNAWLGGLKNIDLVDEFSQNEGFWKDFAAGVEHLEVVEGDLQLKLKE
ncbi:MAG: hypothetical protein V3V09_04180 [Arenicellales bacterium]